MTWKSLTVELGLIVLLFVVLATGHVALQTAADQSSTVWAAALSPDGEQLALASEAGDAVFNVDDASIAYALRDGVSTVRYSHNGDYLAVGLFEGGVELLNRGTGKIDKRLSPHRGRVGCIAFSPDGTLIATVGYDDRLIISRTEDGSLLHAVDAGDDHKWAVAFVWGGTHVVTAGGTGRSEQHELRVWAVDTGQLVRTLTGTQYCYVSSLDVASDGNTVALGLSIPTVMIWDLRAGTTVRAVEVHGGEGVRFLNDGLLVAAKYGGGHVVDLEQGRSVNLGRVAGYAKGPLVFPNEQFGLVDEAGVLRRWSAPGTAAPTELEGFTLRTPPPIWQLLAVFAVWLTAWLLFVKRAGVTGLDHSLLVLVAGLFLGGEVFASWVRWSPWADNDPISVYSFWGLAQFTAFLMAFVRVVAISIRPPRRRMVPVTAASLIALAGALLHAGRWVHGVASV